MEFTKHSAASVGAMRSGMRKDVQEQATRFAQHLATLEKREGNSRPKAVEDKDARHF